MYSPFRAFIFISALLFSISAGPAKRELCQLITSESPNSSPAQLFMNTLPVKQSSCVKFFSLDLENPMFEGKYVTIEVNFHDLPNVLALQPKLLYKINSKPLMYFNYQSHSTNHVNIEEDAHGTDSNAFFNRKAYHHIVLTPEVIKNGGVSYFAVYKASSAEAEYFNGTISYDINIKTSETFPCPQHCSGNGKCNQKHKKCACNKGFFDLDCSVQAAPLIPQKITTESVEGFKWGYFYYQTDSGLEDIKLNVAKSGGRVRFSLLVRDAQDSSLPNFHDSEGSSTLTPKENDIELAITRPLLSGDNNDRQVVIGVYNFDDQPVAVGIEIELSDSKGMAKTIILFSVAGILVGLAAFLATLLFIKYRYPRIWTWTDQEQNTQSQITKEEVEKYFPQHQFNHFKSSFPQTLCSICLEDFTKDSGCRQLYCEHIYHGDCIDAWIIQHENCPNCKKEMTREAIKAHLSKAGPNQNPKTKQTNGENNHHITVQIPTPKTRQADNEQDRLLNMSNMSHTTTP